MKQKQVKTKLKKAYAKVFNVSLSTKAKTQLMLFFAAFLLLILWAIFSVSNKGIIYRIARFLVDQEAVDAAISSAGIFAPLVFMLMQVIQTVISPIPGNVIAVAGGFMFGWWGILFSTVGCLIGYSIVLALSRHFGRRFVEKIISKELLAKFDYLADESGSLVFFLIFLIPALPDDIVMYLAGLTNIPINQILFLATVGRLPSMAIANQFGNSINERNIGQAICLALISLVVVGLCIWKRKFIMDFVGPRRKERLRRLRKKIEKIYERIKAKLKKSR